MNRKEALSIWSPTESPWSPWTKPVLFSFMPEDLPDVSTLPPTHDRPWRVPLTEGAVLLVELPGASGVELGLDLARRGYRPIPLYNACPHPLSFEAYELPLTSIRFRSAVDVMPILQALIGQTSRLRQIALPPAAPPAFLLDADRLRSSRWSDVDWFDNRSIVRTTDLPTATFLRSQGIRKVILIQAKPDLSRDLRTVLRSWQEGGVTTARQIVGEPWAPQAFVVPRTWWLRAWWDQNFLELGYPFKSDGSFGRFVQHASG